MAKVGRLGDRWQVRGACCRSNLTADQPCQPTHTPVHPPPPLTSGGNDELDPDTAGLKSRPPLMRGVGIHKNNPVSVTKLILGHRVGLISSHLTPDKFFPVNPRSITGSPNMSLLFEAKSSPADYQTMSYPCCAHD